VCGTPSVKYTCPKSICLSQSFLEITEQTQTTLETFRKLHPMRTKKENTLRLPAGSAQSEASARPALHALTLAQYGQATFQCERNTVSPSGRGREREIERHTRRRERRNRGVNRFKKGGAVASHDRGRGNVPHYAECQCPFKACLIQQRKGDLQV
jgi:hypothetical protein